MLNSYLINGTGESYNRYTSPVESSISPLIDGVGEWGRDRFIRVGGDQNLTLGREQHRWQKGCVERSPFYNTALRVLQGKTCRSSATLAGILHSC